MLHIFNPKVAFNCSTIRLWVIIFNPIYTFLDSVFSQWKLKCQKSWFTLPKMKLQQKVRRIWRATCLDCRVSQRSRTGTHTDRWHDGTARCCAHTADTSGCSGARRTQENRLQAAERVSRGQKISHERWMEQEVYNYETQHDKSDRGSREKSWMEELKQKKRDSKGPARAEKSVIIVINVNLSAVTDRIVKELRELQKSALWQVLRAVLWFNISGNTTTLIMQVLF